MSLNTDELKQLAKVLGGECVSHGYAGTRFEWQSHYIWTGIDEEAPKLCFAMLDWLESKRVEVDLCSTYDSEGNRYYSAEYYYKQDRLAGKGTTRTEAVARLVIAVGEQP